jgi:hypothetical protein
VLLLVIILLNKMPPTTAWGTSFIATSLATRTGGDIFRFLAKENGTQVSINGSVVATLNAGQFHQADLASNSVYSFTSNKPILVGQYSKGQAADGVVADPFFALVPPDDQFLTDYIISSGTNSIPNNFVNITSKTSNTSAVMVDNVAVPSGSWTSVSGTSFSTARVPLTAGVHTISSTLPVGVFAYGFGNYDSYGYLGGQSFSPVATVSSFSLDVQQINAIQAQEKCVEATVLDQNNNPVVGVLVNFAISGVNNTAGFGNTNTQGKVQLCYKVCLPGQDTLVATIAGLSDTAYISIAPSSLSINPTTATVAAGNQQCITATVVDGSNVPVPNAVVLFNVTGANTANSSINTDPSGQATFCYTPAVGGTDNVVVSAGCTNGNQQTATVTVTSSQNNCANPITANIRAYNVKSFWGLPDPNTFYFGVTQWKRLRVNHSGGTAPYTYTWSITSGNGTLKNQSGRNISLFEPTGPVTVSVTIDDAGGCQTTETINIAWDDQYFCGTINPVTQNPASWYLKVCDNGISSCVPWGTAKNMIRFGTATLGDCVSPKKLHSTR